jgi:hypothetical protein
MANTDNAHGFKFEKVLEGNTVALDERPTTSGADIAAGDALMVDANGRLKVATAGAVAIVGVAAEAVTGVSTEAGEVLFYPALKNIVFSGQVDSAFSLDMMYRSLGIIGTTGSQELDSSGGEMSHAKVVGLKDGEAYSSHADVLFIWKESDYVGVT